MIRWIMGLFRKRETHTEEERQIAAEVARHYFCPRGCWDGYAKFFEPTVPGNVGTRLLHAVRTAVYSPIHEERCGAAEVAIQILKRSHKKKVFGSGGTYMAEVECIPTTQAEAAIKYLEKIRK